MLKYLRYILTYESRLCQAFLLLDIISFLLSSMKLTMEAIFLFI